MVGTKGYSSYRGRGPKWKILLAILLVLVIAVAASVIAVMAYFVTNFIGQIFALFFCCVLP